MGFAKNKNLFMENCLKKLSWHYSGVYGTLAECLSDLKSRPNQDAEKAFYDRDSNVIGNKQCLQKENNSSRPIRPRS